MLYSAIILITLRQKRLGTVRNMYWDEDDRLSVLTDDGMMNRYTYDASDPQPGYGFTADSTATEETFYYHSDHLGSTSYVTDDSARVTQFVGYLPYGESLVDEHSSSEEMPYKFNGKELDEETGLYDYGARNYDAAICQWTSVDPLAEKYYNVSPYVYCGNNPINAIDSDGKKVWTANGGAYELILSSLKSSLDGR